MNIASSFSSSPGDRPRLRPRRRASRRIAPLALVAFFVFAAGAQAHDVVATATCDPATGNSVTFAWSSFKSGTGNGGENTPVWTIVYTPTMESAVTQTGSVSFPGATDTLTVPLPNGAGTIVASSSWTKDQTTDGSADSFSFNLSVPDCLDTPTIATTAGAPTGGTLFDSAVLSGGRSPTGTITFKLYSASDTSCSDALSTVTTTVDGNGSYVSPAVSESTPGTYQWTASYGGDANNDPVAEGCNQPAEQTTIPPLITTISTKASPSVAAGGSISDSAVLGGGNAPTGTITFKLYKASDTTCSNALSTGTVAVHGDGTYASPAVTEDAAGTYQWTASYGGDGNNAAVAEGCNQPGTAEQVTVTPSTPSIVTTAAPHKGCLFTTATPTCDVSDVAVLSGGTAPTGTITFKLYRASDTTCSNALETDTVPITGDGSVSSKTYSETAHVAYQWTASYSGDANNAAVAEGCGATGEQVPVQPPGAKCTSNVKVHLYGPFNRTINQGVVITARLSALIGIKNVTFSLDHTKLGTVRKSHKGYFSMAIKTAGLSFRLHTVKAVATQSNKNCKDITKVQSFVVKSPNVPPS